MAASQIKGPAGDKKTTPSTSQLVFAALRQSEDRNGLSARGIQAYIARTYPGLPEKPGFNSRLKKCLLKGLDNNTLKRPKKSLESPGITGYFKLGDKAKKTAEPKAKTSRSRSASPSAKKTAAATKKSKTAQPKAKSVSKSRSRSRSKSPSKSKATKTKKTAASAKSKTKSPKKASEKKPTAKKSAAPKAAAKKPAKPKPKKSKDSA